MSITLVGDVHGGLDNNRRRYQDIMHSHEYTVQLGDCDFDYDMDEFDAQHHKIIPGNHDDHERVYYLPHCLGRFGYTTLNDISFFYVCGAFSIDRMGRQEYVDWFPNEELSYKEMYDAAQLYQQIKPDLVLTHDCPQIVAQMFFGICDPSHTRNGLQWMFDWHKPKLWVFGHHHKPRNEEVLGTRFICLPELATLQVG
jgi:predicted phosphodiesterase